MNFGDIQDDQGDKNYEIGDDTESKGGSGQKGEDKEDYKGH